MLKAYAIALVLSTSPVADKANDGAKEQQKEVAPVSQALKPGGMIRRALKPGGMIRR
ncbi:hypothetical protein [Neptunicella sp. SCSIO 80796]|uniref:hypothetical protein n=1 Tax=Neptunicella plasticusilytica TaxID=3117012 RepID=UPI003A4D50B6